MAKVICFDLDDTLIDSDYKFQLTFCDCIKTVLVSFETHGPQIDEVLEIARKLDNEKIASYPPETKYMPQRLYDTWLETYALLCEQYQVKSKSYIKLQIKGIIGQNFDAPWYVIPGAVATLESLSKQKDTKLHVLTVGQADVQTRKLVSTHLDKYFQHIEVTTGDKQAYLEELAKEVGAENVIMVGNSTRSDINPALRAGVKAIYIPRSTWHHFYEASVTNNYQTVKDIRELIGLLAA